jgi:CheY-like chemotaxis protein
MVEGMPRRASPSSPDRQGAEGGRSYCTGRPIVVGRSRMGPPQSLPEPGLMDRSLPHDEDRSAAKILVAEDHLDSREALRALLEAFGFSVVLAVNGREAIDVALAEHPDLILMDIMMPELDGLEATRALRGHAAHRGTPIIAVTAMDGARELAIEAGATDCVSKPVDIRNLMAKVNGWIGRTTS